MAVRQIVTLGNPALRQQAKRVHRVDENVQRLIDDMIDTVHDANGAGLAAPQVGVPLRVFITTVDDLKVYINPEITWRSPETDVLDEGCLSIPGYAGPVERSLRVEVRALGRNGKKMKVQAEEWLARAIQHELDHLDGVLYIDRVEDKSTIHRVTEDYEVEDTEHEGSGADDDERLANAG